MQNNGIGTRIREKRKDKKITQKELAKLIGKSESTIQKYENNSVEIPVSVIEEIAKVIGTTVSYLLGYEENENDYSRFLLFRRELESLGCTFDLYGCTYSGHTFNKNEGYYLTEDNKKIIGCNALFYDNKERKCLNCDIKDPFYIVSYNDSVVKIPVNEFENLQSEFESFIRFKLTETIKKFK